MKVTITLTESVISLTLSSITFLLNSLLKPVSYQNDIWRSLWFSFPDLDFTTISPTIAACYPTKLNQKRSYQSVIEHHHQCFSPPGQAF
ncbi:hypothetical protein NC653_001849 [Populus alba x Populus x berolinensis]|uniref:Uncharacterized protein n=1 Tax=Populus alba x Populus x berolinensis TaxID=444605 RepID=A0AAD6WG10_9ROSI|nr:hypothetical protein NC653_001849 [Populus alba x Populus x berolinensis]